MSWTVWLPLGMVGIGLYWFVATIVFRLLVRHAERIQNHGTLGILPGQRRVTWAQGHNDLWWAGVPLGTVLWPLLVVVVPLVCSGRILGAIGRAFYAWAGTILSLFGQSDEP